MVITKEEKKELQEVLDRTGGMRETIMHERIVPEWYRNYLTQVDRKEYQVAAPAAEVPVRCIVSEAKDRKEGCPVHINLHGGGFVFSQNEDDDLYCAHVAAEIHGIVVDVDYALAWDHPFPTAFEQGYAVLLWTAKMCREWGGNPNLISVGGHSAGGCLAAAICLRAVALGQIKPVLQILDYGALDLYKPILPGGNERTRVFSRLYSGGDSRILRSPYCSPVFASDEMLKGQPKTVVITAAGCEFKSCNEEYALRLAIAGTEVTIKHFSHSRHGFSIRLVDEWEAAQNFIIHAIQMAQRRR